MKWEEYEGEFEFDGSLRDIYVLDTTIDDWEQIINLAHSGTYKIKYAVNGDEFPLPQHASTIFARQDGVNVMLSLCVGTATLNCHFFTAEEIEFDLDPREIRTKSQANEILAFMSHIGRTLNKSVVMTAENSQEKVILDFDPIDDQIRYTPHLH